MQKGPLELTYRIYEYTAKRPKPDDTGKRDEDAKAEPEQQTNNGNDWKEVQLRISENGEMSVMGIQEAEQPQAQPKREPPALKLIGKSPTINTSTATTATSCSNTGTTCVNVLSDTPKVKTAVEGAPAGNVSVSVAETVKSTASVVCTSPAAVVASDAAASTKTSAATVVSETKPAVVNNATSKSEVKSQGTKHKIETGAEGEPPQKQTKPTAANHSLGLQHLSNNHPLKKHSQSARNAEGAFAKPPATYVNKNLSRPGTPIAKYPPRQQPPPCYMPKTTYTPIINVPRLQTSAPSARPSATVTTPTNAVGTKMTIKSKPSTPIGYKTLRDPPRSWNPQISRAKPGGDPKGSDLKNVRPAKFFKMRNNMPRYLGNPASGVKPMYQVHTSPEKGEGGANKPDKSEIRKHSIVKIDPKTLKPISEKAPETTSLSIQSDLKINTSSVPIFNPLKLQGSSPKNERKSPHSPKLAKTSPPSKREKPNLSFTPPNPFIPNLASPTVNPNQFIYPSGPPGYPSYDPRFMAAAYHSLFYGQRMPFSPNHLQGLTLDLNQRMGPSTSPKAQPAKPVARKSGKEAQKAEKSLQNAVEKLTQKKAESMANNGEAAKVGKSEKSNSVVEKPVAVGEREAGEKKKSGEEEVVKKAETKGDISETKEDKSDKNVDTGTKLDQEKNLSNNNTDGLASLVQVDGKK